MDRLRGMGIELQAARNTAFRELVRDVPAPIAARLLGYSDQVTKKHAAAAAAPWAAYADAVREQAGGIHRLSGLLHPLRTVPSSAECVTELIGRGRLRQGTGQLPTVGMP